MNGISIHGMNPTKFYWLPSCFFSFDFKTSTQRHPKLGMFQVMTVSSRVFWMYKFHDFLSSRLIQDLAPHLQGVPDFFAPQVLGATFFSCRFSGT